MAGTGQRRRRSRPLLAVAAACLLLVMVHAQPGPRGGPGGGGPGGGGPGGGGPGGGGPGGGGPGPRGPGGNGGGPGQNNNGNDDTPQATPSPSPSPAQWSPSPNWSPSPSPSPSSSSGASASPAAASGAAKDTVVAVRLQLTGSQVAPLTAAKQTAIIAGLVSLLGGGVQASDITLQSIGDSASQSGLSSAGRRLLQPPQLPALPGLPGSAQQQQQQQQAASTISATNSLASQQGSGSLLVLAQILTSSANAQLMLDALNRDASNGQLLNALSSHGLQAQQVSVVGSSTSRATSLPKQAAASAAGPSQSSPAPQSTSAGDGSAYAPAPPVGPQITPILALPPAAVPALAPLAAAPVVAAVPPVAAAAAPAVMASPPALAAVAPAAAPLAQAAAAAMPPTVEAQAPAVSAAMPLGTSPAPAPQASGTPSAQSAAANGLIHIRDGKANGIPIWIWVLVGLLAFCCALSLVGFFVFRWWRKYQADKKQAEYLSKYFGADSASKPHNPYSGGSLSKTASYDGGIGRYSAKLEASNLDRGLSNAGLYATPHRTHSARSARSATSTRSGAAAAAPLRTGGSATSAGSGRRLQMARPNRSVLNTEAPPQIGRREVYINETPKLAHFPE